MDILLRVEVELEGVTWTFGPADKAQLRFARLTQGNEEMRKIRDNLIRAGGGENEDDAIAAAQVGVDADKIPDQDVREIMCEWFVEGVRGWTGLTSNGTPVPFSRENAADIPTDIKIAVVTAVWEERNRLLRKKQQPPG